MKNNRMMTIIIYILIILIIILGIVFYIKKSANNIDEETVETYVKVKNDNIQLIVGESTTIEVDSNTDVIFTSNNPNIAIVNKNGLVTSLSEGNTTIVVKSIDNKNEVIVSIFVDNKLEVNKVNITSTNKLSKKYVKYGDELDINIEFNKKVNNNIKIMINDKQVDYDTFDSHIFIKKKIDENVSPVLMIYDGNVLIYTNSLPIIDNQKPSCSLVHSGEYLIINGKDNNAVVSYDISQSKIPNYSSKESIKFDKYGVWYGYVIDVAGNESSCSLTIEKPKPKIINPENITFVGDSRMVGVCQNDWFSIEKGNCIAKIGQGYKWLLSDAIPEVDKLSDDKKQYIISNLGANDVYNLDKYIAKYQELATGKWKNYMIFIQSIDPSDGKASSYNSYFDDFNSKMRAFTDKYPNISYCDTNTYLKEHGFSTYDDGVHYRDATQRVVYKLLKDCIYNYYNK